MEKGDWQWEGGIWDVDMSTVGEFVTDLRVGIPQLQAFTISQVALLSRTQCCAIDWPGSEDPDFPADLTSIGTSSSEFRVGTPEVSLGFAWSIVETRGPWRISETFTVFKFVLFQHEAFFIHYSKKLSNLGKGHLKWFWHNGVIPNWI